MMNSPFQGAEIPGMGSMNDPLGFVKKLWGDMHLPGMVTPTVSIDELDKKIKDLQTVESWLTVNMNMLRGTIQALEVQRATISTLKTMGENFAQQMNTPAASGAFAARAAETKPNAAWPMPSAPAAEKAPEPVKEVEPEVEVPKPAAQGETAAPFANPAAWWGLLQDQFKQAVSKAMEGDAAVAPGAAKKPAAGTAAKTSKAAKAPAKSAARGAPASAAKSVAKPAAKKTAARKTAPK